MMKDIEVEIRRPFNDPAKRVEAMCDLAEMILWLQSYSPEDDILYCAIDDGEIVWKFGGTWRNGSSMAATFNERFT